jgi:hypothetical protein
MARAQLACTPPCTPMCTPSCTPRASLGPPPVHPVLTSVPPPPHTPQGVGTPPVGPDGALGASSAGSVTLKADALSDPSQASVLCNQCGKHPRLGSLGRCANCVRAAADVDRRKLWHLPLWLCLTLEDAAWLGAQLIAEAERAKHVWKPDTNDKERL